MREGDKRAAGFLGARLRALRQEAGLAQRDLAAQVGVSASYLNLIEHDHRPASAALSGKLAAALTVAPDAFEADVGARLARKLVQFAATTPSFSALHARAAALHARFPDWSALIIEILEQNLALRGQIARHQDAIAHDPELATTLHDLLTAVASVRATAEILVETEGLTATAEARFHRNLAEDSARLSERAASLLARLDPSTGAQGAGEISPKEAVKIWAGQAGWNIARARQTLADLPSAAARAEAAAFLATAQDLHEQLPDARLRALLADAAGDLWHAAARAPLGRVAFLERLAFLPELDAGFVLFDGAGQVLRAKEREGFRVPSLGAACALWPVFPPKIGFGALQAQDLTFAPEGAVHRVYVAADTLAAEGPRGAAGYRAAMLVLPPSPETNRAGGEGLAVGHACRVCARATCSARTEPYLHLISGALPAEGF